jgi:hypothetical protein
MGRCIVNDNIYTSDTKISSEYHQHVLELYNSTPIAVGCNFYNKHCAYINKLKTKRKMKELPLKWCYCFIEDYMIDDFINISF